MDKHSELEAFIAVVREGGFSAAGRKLGLTPSALSKQVRRLEDRLGVSLLYRTTRQVQLTEVGRVYYERGRSIVRQFADLEDSVSDYGSGPKGVVRVSMPPGLLRFQIMGMLPGFHQRYPEIRLVFESSDRYVDLVEEGIDVAVRVGALGDSSLVARKIARFHRVVVAAPSYLEEHGVPLVPHDLSAHNCLAVGVNQRTMNHWEFAGPEGPQTIEVSGMFQASTLEAVHDAAVAGVGIARVSPFLAGEWLATGRLVSVLTDYDPPARASLQVVYPSSRHLSSAVRAFIDVLVAHLSNAAKALGIGVGGAGAPPASSVERDAGQAPPAADIGGCTEGGP